MRKKEIVKLKNQASWLFKAHLEEVKLVTFKRSANHPQCHPAFIIFFRSNRNTYYNTYENSNISILNWVYNILYN